MATWYQSDFASDGRCAVLDGDAFNNKIVAIAVSPEVAAQIVRDHEFAEQHRTAFCGANAEGA
jgi:hypothetical protein